MTEIATWGGERRVMAWLFRLGYNSDACGRHSHAPATLCRVSKYPLGDGGLIACTHLSNCEGAHSAFCTAPRAITKRTFISVLTSASGSPSTAMMSAA